MLNVEIEKKKLNLGLIYCLTERKQNRRSINPKKNIILKDKIKN